MHAPTLQYAQMRPKGVESNHFAYHLDQLVRAKLIQKQGRDYSLTLEGLALSDRVSHADVTVRKQPHIVTTISLVDTLGQMLLFEHAFQPYLGLVGFVQGRTHFEETIAQAAARELAEKTGITDVPLKHRGIAYINATKNGQTISKILSHVFSATVDQAPILVAADPAKGRSFWGRPDEANKYMPGFLEVKHLLQEKDTLFFEEINTQLK